MSRTSLFPVYLQFVAESKKKMQSDKAFLVVINVTAAEWRIQISNEPQIIGRGKEANIVVRKSDFSVSRKHAKIWIDKRVWIEDLESTYGTRVNGVKLAPRRATEINLNDRIAMGLLEFLLVDEQGMEARAAEIRVDESSSDESVLQESRVRLVEGQLPVATLEQLSNAERDVVLWIMRGVTEAEDIGKHLSRSANTIRTHLNNIFRKLNVHSRHELMSKLLKHDNGAGQTPV